MIWRLYGHYTLYRGSRVVSATSGGEGGSKKTQAARPDRSQWPALCHIAAITFRRYCVCLTNFKAHSRRNVNNDSTKTLSTHDLNSRLRAG